MPFPEGDMKTSQDVLEPGLYSSECCGSERIFEQQDVFERCPNCMSLCEWEFVEQIIDRRQRQREIA
jgi:hypothetical protein